MTISTHLLNHLTDLGMPVEDAEAVLRSYKCRNDKTKPAFWATTWVKLAPRTCRRVLISEFNAYVLAYIDANDPTAPYRERFLEGRECN